MTKVTKVYLISEQIDKDGNKIDFKKISELLWNLQMQTRDIKNKCVQLCWEWLNFSSDYYKKSEEYPKEKDTLGYTLSGFVYDRIKNGSDLYSSNLSTSSRDTCTAFSNYKKEMLKGERSVLSFKANQPLDIHNKAIKLSYENGNFFVALKMLNRAGKEKYGINDDLRFRMQVRDKSVRTILERLMNDEYKVSASKLMYDKKKKLWKLNLCYSFDNHVISTLDPEKIMGVNLGVVYPIMASVNGDYARFSIKGGEIEAFRSRVEARRRSLLNQSRYCGDGRIGHGRKKRTKPAAQIADKIARFRDTTNHKYSRALIDYAIKNDCGTIQMEKLTGITSNAEHFLKEWSYFDLQTKIESKAKEAGIKVVYINPKFTSQRCNKCGYIHTDNRPVQARFCCQKCGYEENADYNASQNIGTKHIDVIIEETLKMQCEPEVPTE